MIFYNWIQPYLVIKDQTIWYFKRLGIERGSEGLVYVMQFLVLCWRCIFKSLDALLMYPLKKSYTKIQKSVMSLTHLRNLEFDSGSFPRRVSSGLFALLSCSLIFSRFPWALTFCWPWCGHRDAWALRCFSGAFSFANNFLRNIFKATWFPWTSL